VARLPLPGHELTAGELSLDDPRAVASVRADQVAGPRAVASVRADQVPAGVRAIARGLRGAGHEAHLVGGCVRDLLRGVAPLDWDVATDARPDQLLALFPGARYENRFGTVAVSFPDGTHEVTTFRLDGTYSDHRRPDDVAFGDTLDEDLARRDFTVNAMAIPLDADGEPGALVDRFDGQGDLVAGVLRAVGDPRARFREDALRMLRAVRFAATLGFVVEPATRDAIAAEAALAAHVSGERTFVEMMRLLGADRPSVGLRLAEATGLLAVLAPELARQRGIPQAKTAGEDLWDHTCRTVDAAAATLVDGLPLARVAALLHDVGKPATFADGHFVGHDVVGARLADAWLEQVRAPRAFAARVANLVRHHMFAYTADWTDAAVRRFIRRVGLADLDALLDLRAADNVGSGLAADVDGLEELRARCRAQVAAHVALGRADLVVDGDDVMRAVGMAPGPAVGRLLDELLERVLVDPMLNERTRLLALARDIAADEGRGAADEGRGADEGSP
jgi:tRNA nucleotidyltransferase (CCA-adding enzyme)